MFRKEYSLFSYMLRNMIISIFLITLTSFMVALALVNLLLLKESDFVPTPYRDNEDLILAENYSDINIENLLGSGSYFYVLNDDYELVYISDDNKSTYYHKDALQLLPSERKANSRNVGYLNKKGNRMFVKVEYNDKELETTLIDEGRKVIFSNVLNEGIILSQGMYECFVGKNELFLLTKNDFLLKDGSKRYIVFFNYLSNSDTSVLRVMEILFIILVCVLIIIILGSSIYLYHLNRKVIKPIKVICAAIKNFEINHNTYYMSYKGIREFNEMIEQLDILFKKLSRYEEEKNMYIASISHDIKTPLSVIKGYSLSLYNGLVKPEKYENILMDISRKSDDIVKMINVLGDYAQLNSGKMILRTEKTNISEFLRNYIINLYSSLELRGVTIDVEIEDGKNYCNIDSFQLKRVFNNIIENSIKYNCNDLKIYFNLHFTECGEVIIRVGDNGKGIIPEIRDRIFDAFVTGNQIRKPGLGTGLGMTIAYRIVKLHEGSIKLLDTQKSNCSVEFEISLPINKIE